MSKLVSILLIYYLGLSHLLYAENQKRDFVGVEDSKERGLILKVFTKTKQGIKFYRWTVEIGGKTYRLRTTEPYFYIAQTQEKISISTKNKDIRLGLGWSWIKPYQHKKRTITIDPFSADDDQIAFEPADTRKDSFIPNKGNRIQTSKESARRTLEPLSRSHSVRWSIRKFEEEFTVLRDELYQAPKSSGLGTSFSGEYYLKPEILLALALDTHASETIYVEPGSDAPASLQRRMTAVLSPRIDTINLQSRYQNMSLHFGPSFGFHMLPVEKDNQLIYDLGLSLNWHWIPMNFQIDGHYFNSSSRLFNVTATSPWGWNRIFPFLGYYQRNIIARSDSNKSDFFENGIRLGLAVSW
jgi:hypothetical protein